VLGRLESKPKKTVQQKLKGKNKGKEEIIKPQKDEKEKKTWESEKNMQGR
jgi:hypothetical protein